MKTPKYIEDIFRKYVKNTLTKGEFNTLLEFIRNPKSKDQVKELFDKYWENLNISKEKTAIDSDHDSEILFQQILGQIESQGKKTASKQSKTGFYFKIAASLLLFFGTSYYFYQHEFTNKNKVISSPVILDSNAITLTLSDGNVKVISENGEEKILDKKGKVLGAQKGNQITYSNIINDRTEISTETLVYNELNVPYGKLFDLELSDGTIVKLNSGSSIKYPVKFIKGFKRKVFLKGEAYFEVIEDKAHPFIVNANDVNVEVLGTAFNMSFYPEDVDISTVLVEGSVKLYEETTTSNNAKDITLLTPGHKAEWDKNNKQMSVSPVDTNLYTAWKDGVLLFRKSTYNNIVKKLERHYDVTIENHYAFLASQVYTATFRSQEETIEDVLEAFKEDTPFKYIKVNGNKIIITEP